METLNNISSNQYANDAFGKIDQNFSKVKSAVDALEQSGGGGSTPSVADFRFVNVMPYEWVYEEMASMKVLVIGNSYTYWPLLAYGAVIGLDTSDSFASKYSLQNVAYSGTGLSGFCSNFNSASTVGLHIKYGDALTDIGATSTKTGLQKSWDAIIFQQVSTQVTDYTTYMPYLPALIEAAKRYCTNPYVRIGWHMIWDKNHDSTTKDRSLILENTKKVVKDFDIDFVIPTGTAFENAWSAGLLPNGSMRSGGHYDVSGHTTSAETQFLASATWYQALMGAFRDKDVVTDLTSSLTESVSWTGHNSATMTISAANAKLAAKCAKAACDDMWNVTNNIS